VQGRTGAQGLDGTGGQGIQGIIGSQGINGNQGIQGFPGAGSQGRQGVQGWYGFQGFQGKAGIDGIGTQGVQGVQGPYGFQGPTGTGLPGGPGAQGVQGRTGAQGANGSGTGGTTITGLKAAGLLYTQPNLAIVNSYGLYTTDGASLIATGNITAYGASYTPSDQRWKTNIKTIENALGKIRQLRGVMYDWTDEFLKDKPDYLRKYNTGLIAQEVEKVLPEVVNKNDDGMLTVSYDKMIGLVVQSINELADQVDQFEKFVSKRS
jgi:hypothetical protein